MVGHGMARVMSDGRTDHFVTTSYMYRKYNSVSTEKQDYQLCCVALMINRSKYY